MKDIIDRLPGVELPVGEVTNRLESMWESDAMGSPSAFRASQMNVVIHFGWEVSEEAAQERFDALLTFAQRYPSRIIVLCPSRSITDGSMRAKLFSQCYIGESHREMCCCEALLLGYQPDDCGYLANQVSVWLEPDLPSYHWFCGVPRSRIEQYLHTLLVGVRRSIYDSSFEGAVLDDLDWPGSVGDLAMARLLPVRQTIGQYLSSYSVESLCENLTTVTVRHCETMSGEGQRLMQWIQECLSDCETPSSSNAFNVNYVTEVCTGEYANCALMLEFSYSDERYFRAKKFANGSMGELEANLGKSVEKVSARVKPLAAEQAIAEALFF